MLKCCELSIFLFDLEISANCENIVIIISVVILSQNIYFQLWLVTVSYFIILFRLVRNWHINNCENIMKFVVSV